MSDYISGDNLALILRWLPVKILLRFRCVCKLWKEIIDSPFFHQEHLSLQKPRFLVQNETSLEYFVVDPHALPSANKLNGLYECPEFSFLGTHHGVVCLYDYNGINILLWNPSIRKLLTVPVPDYFDCGWEYVQDESCFGFWINPSSKDFKFIMLNSILDEEDKQVGVEAVLYSSVLQEWRLISPAELDDWMPLPPVMIQGVAHWRGNKSADNASIILSFDFVHERFDLIDMPDLIHSYVEILHFHWQEALSLVVKDRRSPFQYNMYMRQEGLWVNMFEINLEPPITKVLWVLGEEDRFRLLAEAQDKLVLYDTRTGIIHLRHKDSNDEFNYYDDDDNDRDFDDEFTKHLLSLGQGYPHLGPLDSAVVEPHWVNDDDDDDDDYDFNYYDDDNDRDFDDYIFTDAKHAYDFVESLLFP